MYTPYTSYPPTSPPPPPTYLYEVCDVALSIVVAVEDQVGLVLRDGVAMEGVAGRHHFPGQPARAEDLVARQEAREMPGISTATPVVISNGFCDGFHFALVTVSAL